MILHTCSKGETVSHVAKIYGVSPSKIVDDNQLDPACPMKEGETLLLFPGADYHTVRGGEDIDGICQKHGIKREKLYRQNPALSARPYLTAGCVLNVSAEKKPPLALFVRCTCGDKRRLAAILPHVSGFFLPGGRITEKYTELPRRKFLPSSRRVFAEVVSHAAPTEKKAEYIWAELRKNDFSGLLLYGDHAEEWRAALLALRKEGEWLFSMGESQFADFEIGADTPSLRTVPLLPLGGILVTEEETRRLSEEEKDRLLAKWHSPILKSEGGSLAKRTVRLGERQWEDAIRFFDVEKLKTEFEEHYKLGQRGFFVESSEDLTVKIRCLLGGLFD